MLGRNTCHASRQGGGLSPLRLALSHALSHFCFLFVRQMLCYGFLQIPPRDGHSCRSLWRSPCRAASGLSPVSRAPCRAHHKKSCCPKKHGNSLKDGRRTIVTLNFYCFFSVLLLVFDLRLSFFEIRLNGGGVFEVYSHNLAALPRICSDIPL